MIQYEQIDQENFHVVHQSPTTDAHLTQGPDLSAFTRGKGLYLFPHFKTQIYPYEIILPKNTEIKTLKLKLMLNENFVKVEI
jgi:hypothetical protein